MRLLDVQRAGGLTAFDVCYFFRAVVEKFDEFGVRAQTGSPNFGPCV